MSANETILMQLTVLENACSEIRKALGLAPVTSEKKSKKTSEPSGEPKEKRAPSDYIVFSSKRVGPLVHKAEEGKEKKSRVGTVNQFAGFLWGQKKEWTDEEILAAWPLYTPPEVSKQALKKSSGSSTGSDRVSESEPVADEPKPTGKGSRGPQSEETKTKAKAKREENRVKKNAEKPVEKPVEDTFEEVESAPATLVAPVAPVLNQKIKAGKKVVDLWLDAWEHDGEHFFKNERGDVLTTDGAWAGHWNGKMLDISAPKPADFAQLDVRPPQ